jgi:hypothetical protein
MSPKSDKAETAETDTQVVEESVTTPEPEKFDEARAKELIDKLREIEKKGKADAKRLAEYEKNEQARIDAEKSELQKAQDRAAKAESEAKEIRLALLRRDAATKTKLPLAFADRIKGETPEDMEADAAAMLEAMPKAVAPKLEPTNPSAPQTGETEADRKKRLGLSR